jgi:hypothetical protein
MPDPDVITRMSAQYAPIDLRPHMVRADETFDLDSTQNGASILAADEAEFAATNCLVNADQVRALVSDAGFEVQALTRSDAAVPGVQSRDGLCAGDEGSRARIKRVGPSRSCSAGSSPSLRTTA